MKSKYAFLLSVLAIAGATNASAITRTFNLTGATAFRAGAHSSIITLLGGGTTVFAYTGTKGIDGADRSIFQGTMAAFPSDTIIVRCSWSGSTAGVLALADAAPVQLMDPASTMTVAPGTHYRKDTLEAGSDPIATYNSAVARWAFSDVDKRLSTRPNASIGGGPVGVVPFMFLAGEGSPASITNMTDQIHRLLWSNGSAPASIFTGVAADAAKTALATGRNNGSGTRALILSETGYGAFTNVVQYNATFTGTEASGSLTNASAFTPAATGGAGHDSNSKVRDLLTRTSAGMTFDGSPVDAFFVSYLTISDALAAIPLGAKEMKYNGVNYTEENVKNGSYTLWGYQQLYLGNSPTTAENTFNTAFRAVIPGVLNVVTSGIPITQMAVTRTGGDGGPVFPNN